jgi:Flp pilus assembly protein TadG
VYVWNLMCLHRRPDVRTPRLDPLRSDESGATLVIAAMVLLVLVGMAGFAVDYGWLYWNGIKIQHGADAAALAGVIYEPGDQDTAYAVVRGAAAENGSTI